MDLKQIDVNDFPMIGNAYSSELQRVTAELYQRQAVSAVLQAEVERRLAAYHLPAEIAGWIRFGERDRPYPPETYAALEDLWNDLADAGGEEQEARDALAEFLELNDTGTPREPWDLTAAEYIGDPKVYDLPEWSSSWGLGGAEKYIEHTLRIIRPGYAVARIFNDGRGVVLLKNQAGAWTPVGSYRGIELGILPEERGKGLSAELIIEKGRAIGGAPVGGGYSEAGLRAHLSAHRKAVEAAFAMGLIDPESELAERHYKDYPHLRP